ncbi:hypothetical protein AB0G73_03730 [Streptomyces sp. NPDC020719]|uniref:hypothetical protein n=1 Tax=Streptomyces sp. NPDC020719 TaxID=3154896 RepID=UPI0033C9B3EA
MPLEEGDPRQIGAFRLLGVLGSGGMGRVYLGAVPGKFAAELDQFLFTQAPSPPGQLGQQRAAHADQRTHGRPSPLPCPLAHFLLCPLRGRLPLCHSQYPVSGAAQNTSAPARSLIRIRTTSYDDATT